MASQSNIFRLLGPAEGCRITSLVIGGAEYDYSNKVNGKYNRSNEIANNHYVFTRVGEDFVKLKYVLGANGLPSWKITNSDSDLDYTFVVSNDDLWYEYQYLSRYNDYFTPNTNLRVESFVEDYGILDPGENENGAEISEERQCLICLSEVANFGVLHQGSMHLCMCRGCAQLFSETSCPVCRENVERIVRVY